jgi:hypothetical protein
MMKTIQSVKILGTVLFAAGAVHAQTQPAGTNPVPVTSAPPSSTDGPLPTTPSPQPLYAAPQVDRVETPNSAFRSTNEGKFMFGVNWDVGIPIGSAHGFTANTSPVGFELLFQYWATSRVAVGASMDWQTYWDTRPRQTYPVDNGAITATADNSIQNGAIRALGRYYFIDEGVALPYGGLNIGLGWSTFQTAASTLSFYDNTLSILLGAELGVAFAPAKGAPLLNVGARYTALPAASFYAVNDVQSITFQFGVLTP